MKLAFSGWSRFDGTTVAISKAVEHSPDDHDGYHWERVRFSCFDHLEFQDGQPTAKDIEQWGEQQVTGGVRIHAGAPLRLGGNYRVSVELAAEELLQMTIAATKKWPLQHLIDKVVKARTVTNPVHD